MKPYKYIPNALTISRIFLALAFPFCPVHWRLAIIVIALATEFLDGFTARLFKAVTPLGAFLDPLADKAFILIVAFTLLVEQNLLWWEVLFFGFRDVVVLVGFIVLVCLRRFRVFGYVEPDMLGKLTTTFQFLALVDMFYFSYPHYWILFLTFIVSIASGLNYSHQLLRTRFFEDLSKR